MILSALIAYTELAVSLPRVNDDFSALSVHVGGGYSD